MTTSTIRRIAALFGVAALLFTAVGVARADDDWGWHGGYTRGWHHWHQHEEWRERHRPWHRPGPVVYVAPPAYGPVAVPPPVVYVPPPSAFNLIVPLFR